MKKLIQTGVDNEGVFNVMDGLSFARAMNENADELSTETKLDLEVHNTPEALAKAFKEQAGKIGFHTPGGPDDLPTFEEEGAPVNSPSELVGGVAQIYNEAIEGDDPEPEPELVSIEVTTEPTKTTYIVNEELDLSGLVVTATYSDGTTTEVTEYTTSPEEGTILTGSQTVIITYESKTAQFDVKVDR